MWFNPFVRFLTKVIVFSAIWYTVYHLLVLPDGRLDHWLSLNIVEVASGLLSAFGFEVNSVGRLACINQTPGILIVDGCNGIDAIGVFIGFMLAWPGRSMSKASYLFLGMAAIYLVNILRILTLVITQHYWPAFFDITHDYSTTFLFYMAIFALWVIWANYGEGQENIFMGKEV